MKGFLASYWKGEQPLVKSFWLLLILGSVIYMTIAYALIKFFVPPPHSVVLDAQTGNFYGSFTLINARDYSLPYCVAGLIYVVYSFFAACCVLASAKKYPNHYKKYLATLIAGYIFVMSLLRVTELITLYVGMTEIAPMSKYFLDDMMRRQIIFQINHPTTTIQAKAENNVIELYAEGIILLLYSYNTTNYESNLSRAIAYFTHGGWERYQNYNLMRDNTALQNQQMTATITKMDTPQIIKQADLFGKHYWMVYVHAYIGYAKPVSGNRWEGQTADAHFYILFEQPGDSSNIYVESLIVG